MTVIKYMTHTKGKVWAFLLASILQFLSQGALPWHCTRGSPQWNCSHSVHCLPPKPGLQWHWPVNCRKDRRIWMSSKDNIKLFVRIPFCILQFHHVAVSSHGVLCVAVTLLTASLLTIVPVVRRTLITVMARHVLSARAGSGLPVTATLSIAAGRLDGASSHTGTSWEEKHTRNIFKSHTEKRQ